MFVLITTWCGRCDVSVDCDYFLTCAHALAELNSDQNFVRVYMTVLSYVYEDNCVGSFQLETDRVQELQEQLLITRLCTTMAVTFTPR